MSSMLPMLPMLLILIPIFALILAGYVARRRGVLGAHATSEINKFVVWLALPAVLFDIMANTSLRALYQPAYFIAFFGAGMLVFVLILAWQLLSGKHLVDATIGALAAAYPNVGFIGFPLLLVIFGKSSLMPTTIATVVVVCLMFALAISLIETGLQVERHPRKLATKVARSVLKNPLIVSPIAGVLFSASGAHIPVPLEQFLKLMGAAASPCALVCVGLFLADQSMQAGAAKASAVAGTRGQQRTSLLIILAKLGLQPALTWLFAWLLIPLASDLRHMAVLLAALPTGTGPFMLAEYYRRDGQMASTVILVSTLGSIVTLVLLMAWLGVTPV